MREQAGGAVGDFPTASRTNGGGAHAQATLASRVRAADDGMRVSMRCACREPHPLRRVVLTGGPGAGKTAVLELVRRSLCEHVKVLPESAGIVFGGGFPRESGEEARRSAQRAIFYVQRELESAATADNPAIALCDRGTVDGAAYWVGSDTLWAAVGTTRLDQLARYDAVIHLRTPTADAGYDRSNPLRTESALEARIIDERIFDAWEGHARRFIVDADRDFLTKMRRVLGLLRDELPPCCGGHVEVSSANVGKEIAHA